MEAEKTNAPSSTTGDDDARTAAPSTTAEEVAEHANDGQNKGAVAAVAAVVGSSSSSSSSSSSASASEVDFLIFGSLPSHLFDDVALAIDSLLAEEVVATLPLLPRTLTDEDERRRREKEEGRGGGHGGGGTGCGEPKTGEEKLLGALRDAYKKNIDLAEAYCARNVFTVQNYSRTRRRKILESFLAQQQQREEEEGEDGRAEEDDDGEKNDDEEPIIITPPLPATTLAPPPEGELPTPGQIVGMDREILVTRQRLQRAKQRRVRLKRQLERLEKASLTLTGVQEALKDRLGGKNEAGGEKSSPSLQKLKESIANAMEGHGELKVWNARAEEAIRVLDKIDAEREEGKKSVQPAGRKGNRVTGREADEQERKRMVSEIGGGVIGRHGSKEQISSLLKKLRGN